jgi:hypothetical protein
MRSRWYIHSKDCSSLQQMEEDRRTKVQEFQASNYVFLSARDKREAELIASTKEEKEFFKKPGLEVII